jgi:hypothetical protein
MTRSVTEILSLTVSLGRKSLISAGSVPNGEVAVKDFLLDR